LNTGELSPVFTLFISPDLKKKMKFIILSFFLLLQLVRVNGQQIVYLQDIGTWHSIGKNTYYFRDAKYDGIQRIMLPGV